jgi:hypothetical protein
VVSLIPDAFDNVCDKRNARPDCIKHLVRLIAWSRAGTNPKGDCCAAAPLSKLQKYIYLFIYV